MLDLIGQARGAIEALETKLRAITSNISNMSVPGYKRIDVSFQEVFNKVIRQGTAADTTQNQGGTNPQQVGGGIAISNISVDMTQGSLAEGADLALAISGSGFFVVSPDGGASNLYSRSGNFSVDASGKLVTDSGMQVYGFARSGGSTNTGTLVPIGLSGQTYTNPTFDTNGVLRASYTKDATTGIVTYGAELPFQIALTTFPNPGGLEQRSGTTFAQTAASGSPTAAAVPTTNSKQGVVNPRMIEQSNVFYIGETIDALEVQRAMSGNLEIVKMINDTISQFISKLS